MAEQIQEYESQLADVEALLEASPEDPSLLSLKSDLMELLAITKQQTADALTGSATEASSERLKSSFSVFDRELEAAVGKSIGREEVEGQVEQGHSFADTIIEASLLADSVPKTVEAGREPPSKKAKTLKEEFEVPPHLIALDTDTDAERNKKHRALKALKSKWKETKKEMESEQKQKSWHSFQKKKKLKTSSIFKTGDAAVGVVSAAGRQLTEFGERKRHKHDQI
jgi:survival of motor neuron-related-splicing factor 30